MAVNDKEVKLKATLAEIDERQDELKRVRIETSTKLQIEDDKREKVINELKLLAIAKLEEQLDGQREQRAQLDSKIKQMKDSLDKGTEMLKKCMKAKRNAEEERDAMRCELERMEKSLEEFTIKFKTMEDNQVDLKLNCEDTGRVVNETLRCSLEQLQRELCEVREENHQLRNDKMLLAEMCEIKNRELTSLRETVNFLEMELSRICQEQPMISRQHQLGSATSQENSDIERLQTSLSVATEIFRRQMTARKSAEEERDEIKIAIGRVEETIDDYFSHFKTMDEGKVGTKMKCDGARSQFVALENSVEQILRELRQVKQENKQLMNSRHFLQEMCQIERKSVSYLEIELKKCQEQLETSQRVIVMTQQRQLMEATSTGAQRILDETSEPERCQTGEIIGGNRHGEQVPRRESSGNCDVTCRQMPPVNEEHQELLRRVYDSLSSRISALPVAVRMFQRGALTLKELESVQSKRDTPTEAAETLINFLLNQPYEVYQIFIEALKHSNQQDVYGWLIRKALPDYLLDSKHINTIREHYVFLLEHLDSKYSSLLELLWNVEVLTGAERDEIIVRKTSSGRNAKLLSALCRKSADQFQQFLQTLDATDQSHIADKITGRQRDTRPTDVGQRLALLGTTDGPEGLSVTGVTKLGNKLYVIYYKSDTINVYAHRLPFTQLQRIKIDGLKYPIDASASNIHKCMYVADLDGHCIWRVRSEESADKWLDVNNVRRLSMSADGLIVMLVRTDVHGYEGGWTWFGRVLVYSVAAGEQLINIKLPNSIINPRSVVQTTSKTFIISHGDDSTEMNRVCEMNEEGTILASFGGLSSSVGLLGQLASPVFITLDGEERVLVADCFNNQVILLNKHLDTQLRVLISYNDELRPVRLFYDDENGQLLVGLNKKGRVEIYEMHDAGAGPQLSAVVRGDYKSASMPLSPPLPSPPLPSKPIRSPLTPSNLTSLSSFPSLGAPLSGRVRRCSAPPLPSLPSSPR